jgi:hypothetical protein
MKEVDRNEYYKKFAQVSVNSMIMSTGAICYECEKDVQEFSVFVGEGQKMSTLFNSCCSKCLPIVVKKAIADGKKDAEEQIKRAEARLYTESLEFVRKAKLNHLNEVKNV